MANPPRLWLRFPTKDLFETLTVNPDLIWSVNMWSVLFFTLFAFSVWTLRTLSTVQGHRGLLIVRPWGTLTVSKDSTVNKRDTKRQVEVEHRNRKRCFLKNIHDVETEIQSHWNVKGKERLCCTKEAMTHFSSQSTHCVFGISYFTAFSIVACQSGVMSEMTSLQYCVNSDVSSVVQCCIDCCIDWCDVKIHWSSLHFHSAGSH